MDAEAQLHLARLKQLGIPEQIALSDLIPRLKGVDRELEIVASSQGHFLRNGSLKPFVALSQSDFEEGGREGKIVLLEKFIESEHDYQKAAQRLQLDHMMSRDLFGMIELKTKLYYLMGKVKE